MVHNGSVKELNRRIAREINSEARQDPQSMYAGKFVGIASGRVVAVANSWDELIPQLRQVEPDPQKTLCLEAGLDYEEVQEIWRLSIGSIMVTLATPLSLV